METLKKFNILVTGCGGDIGQSIGKILVESNLFKSVLGADINLNHAGIFIYSNCFILPRCDDKNYLDTLTHLIKENNIHILIPISEAEIRFFNTHGISEKELYVKIILANSQALSVGLDKFRTSHFLKDSNLPFPKTFLLSSQVSLQFPLIVKNRYGSGSKNIFLALDETDLNYFRLKYTDYIVQEYLPEKNEEYTCGLFRSTNGEIRNIIFKRTLVGGFSGYGEVILNSEIEKLLNIIAEQLLLNGSINVQLIVNEKKPCIFEINPRFSSTVRFRDLLGFRDLIWSIQDKLGLPIDPYIHVKGNKKFYKGFNEYIN